MRRLILRLMLLLLLPCVLLIAGSVTLGQWLPAPPIAVAVDVPSRADPSHLVIIGVDTPTGVTYQRELQEVRWWTWSDEGCRIALITAGSTPETRVLDVRTGKWTHYQETGYGYMSWSRDGRRAALPARSGDALLLLETRTAQTLRISIPEGEVLQAFVWSPDGTRGILVTRRTAGIYQNRLVDALTGGITEPAPAVAPLINISQQHDWRWSPYGRYVVAVALPDLLVWDVQTNALTHILPRPGFARLADVSWSGSDELMMLAVPQITAGIGTTSAQAGSAGGTTIEAALESQVLRGYVWDIAADVLSPTTLQTLLSRTPPIFSPDGTRILDDNGTTVRVLDAKTGDIILTIPHSNLRPMPNMWSPDGRYLLLASTRARDEVLLVDTHTGSITEQTVDWEIVLAWASDGAQFGGFHPKQKRVALLRPGVNGAETLSNWILGSSAQVCYP